MYEILGYTENWTLTPGETLQLKVSCEDVVGQYDADLVRIRSGDTSPGAPGLKETVIASIGKGFKGKKQYTEPGSYAVVDCFNEPDGTTRSWMLGLMPTLPGNGIEQSVFGRWDEAKQTGYMLSVDPEGRLKWTVGDGSQTRSIVMRSPLVARQWYRVAITMDRQAGLTTLRQDPVSPLHALNGCDVAQAQGLVLDDSVVNGLSLTMGAVPSGVSQPRMYRYFNGRLDSLILMPSAATDADLYQISLAPEDRNFSYPVVMSWDFSQGIDGDKIHDTACHGRVGKLYNIPTRAVPGIRWNAVHTCWVEKPDHYAAIHFHEDSLEDAQWDTEVVYTLPDSLSSGLYAARLRSGDYEERVTFIVRPSVSKKKAKIAFLASTATYLAYSNSHYRFDEPGMEMKSGNFMVLYPWETYLGEHRELGLSHYDTHADGYGVYYCSRRRPVFSMHLMCRTWSLNGDTHLIDWLDEKGFEYDVITDDMIDQEGFSAIKDYNVILTGAHPEYWTTRMWDAGVEYQEKGGRFMYMGGNGFYWRCAYHPEKPWLMELRRTETGARYTETPPGESYHSFTGEYGGTWRRIGRPPQSLVGVGTVATGFDASSYYRRRPESYDPRANFIFEGVDHEIIGDFGSSGGGAAGDEIDRTDIRLGTPPHALVLARSENHTRYYNLVPEETTYHHPTINGQEAEGCYADLTFYECRNGGALFATGSITWGASLAWNGYNNNVSRITENVLKRFASDEPFDFPSLSA